MGFGSETGFAAEVDFLGGLSKRALIDRICDANAPGRCGAGVDGPDFIAATTGSEGPVARRTMSGAAGSVEDLLANVPLFGAIDCRELARLGRQITSPTGAAIVSEGEPGDAFYVLVQGLVEVTIAGRFIRNLQPGDSFREIALFHSVLRTATVTATVESKLWTLERATFLEVLNDTLPTSLSEASSADTELAGAGILV